MKKKIIIKSRQQYFDVEVYNNNGLVFESKILYFIYLTNKIIFGLSGGQKKGYNLFPQDVVKKDLTILSKNK